MKVINVTDGMTSILLGRMGENERTVIVFDVSDWIQEYPDASYVLINRQPFSDEEYPVVISQPEDGKINWLVSGTELQVVGNGQCTLEAVEGTVVAKKHIWRTKILEAMGQSGTVPEPWENWMTEFARMAGEADASADDAAEAAEDAADAAEAAEAAQAAAEDARDAAQAAAGNFQGMTAEAEGLAAGADPTITVTHSEGGLYNFEFGIPKGDKGDKGDQGDPAPAATVTAAVDAWLDENVDPETGYVLDRTLQANNAAAPADLVGDLKNEIDDINESIGIKTYPFTSGYISVNISPVNISNIHASDTQMHTVVECTAGDEFYLMGVGSSSIAGLWTFVDSNNNRLTWQGKTTYSDYTKITAPANSAKLIVNVVTAENHGLYSGQIIKERVSALENEMTQKQDVLNFDSSPTKGSGNPVISGGLYEKFVTTPTMLLAGYGTNLFDKTNPENANGKIINISTGELGNNASYFTTYYIPVSAGKIYNFLNGTSTTIKAYVFFDEGKVLIENSGGENKTGGVTAPEGAAYIRATLVGGNASESTWQFLWGTYREPYAEYTEKYVLQENEIPIIIKKSKTKNQYNPLEAVHASINPNDGSLNYIAQTGAPFTTGLIYCAGCNYVVSGLPVSMISAAVSNMTLRAIAFYNEEMDMIQYTENATGDYVYNVNAYAYTRVSIPSGAAYLRIQYNYASASDTPVFIECVRGANAFPLSKYEEYQEVLALKNEYSDKKSYTDTFFSGKTINFIGDSITYGYGTFATIQKPFPNLVGYRLNMVVNNYGINSSEIAERTAGDLTHDPMCIRYADMANDADAVIVAGGTNDWGHSDVTLGEMGDTSINTFYGALDTMCKGLLAKYPGKYIVFMTPIKRMAAGFAYYEPNGLGYTLKQFSDAIKEVCAFYGIPVLDMYEKCQLNPLITEIQSGFFVDGTHPTQAGQMYIASMVAGYVKSLAD